jgi:hypothetical protein
MDGKEMLTNVLLSLQTYLEIVDEDYNEKLIIDEDLNGAISQIRTHPLPQVFDDFVRYLSALIMEDRDGFLGEPYPESGTIHIIDFALPNLDKKNRAFFYSDREFSFFSAKALMESGALVDFSHINNGLLWKQMQTFFERDHNPKQDEITVFFNCLAHNDASKGFILKYIEAPFDAERHYSYIYLSFLNSSHSVPIPRVLNYTTPALNPILSFSGNVEYEQYFDIYDVLNELNQAPDLLTRFMKLYHILEYFMYRVYLVDLVGRVGRNKFFVREFIISSERMKKGERETFIKNFVKIFSTDRDEINLQLLGHVNGTVITFLSQHGLVDNFSANDVNKMAELIYGVRCSIVHNKESEYHLTVSFYEDFIQIIPLIKALVGILEKLLIEKIKTNHVNINYPQREVKLF